jgi:uncharacterized ParB-like nuclease family protein
MKVNPVSRLILMITIFVFSMLVSCKSSMETPENASTEERDGGSGTLAMVDSLTVEKNAKHYYAVINGYYPDACTSISSIEQVVEDKTFIITLLTESPADLMCAEMLTPFTVNILLTTGGLLPQEYSIIVNDGPSTTYILE